MGFTKLWSSLVTSSIWCKDDHVLRVWIAMLVTCNSSGVTEGSVPGFASLCRVTVEQMEDALKILSSPDPHSRTKDNDGRRIIPCDGGWQIVNYLKYREKGQDKTGSRAPYMRGYRRPENDGNGSHIANGKNVTCNSPFVTRNTEAEAEEEGGGGGTPSQTRSPGEQVAHTNSPHGNLQNENTKAKTPKMFVSEMQTQLASLNARMAELKLRHNEPGRGWDSGEARSSHLALKTQRDALQRKIDGIFSET